MAAISDCSGLILAAGKGTRMRSARPKVLQTLLGEPMLRYVIDAVAAVLGANFRVVGGYGLAELEKTWPDIRFINQTEQLGTGHAVLIALPNLIASGSEYVFVVNGDAPLLTASVVREFIERAGEVDVAFATLTLADPASFGRVVREADGSARIVEAKDYDAAKYGAPTGEINAGAYLFRLSALAPLLPLLANDNNSGEYYLTDIISLALEKGYRVAPIDCGANPALLGVNSPAELAAAEEILRAQAANALLESGVVLHFPATVRVSPLARVEPGAELTGPCEIYGQSRVAANAVVESFVQIRDSSVGAFAQIRSFSRLEGAEVKARALIGPYARLRPGAVVGENAHVGNFVELKKTKLGAGSKANHLTYLGDAQIGENVNIGAGTITCNYDGENKFATEICDGAFIGSNAALVAPVRIGERCVVGAGSVITKSTPSDSLAIERSRQKILPRKTKDGKK